MCVCVFGRFIQLWTKWRLDQSRTGEQTAKLSARYRTRVRVHEIVHKEIQSVVKYCMCTSVSIQPVAVPPEPSPLK